MTIKEVIKETLKTNEFLKNIGKHELSIWCDKGYHAKQIKTWQEFKTWIKENVLDELKNEFLTIEFKNNESFDLEYVWFDGYVNKFTYKISIC